MQIKREFESPSTVKLGRRASELEVTVLPLGGMRVVGLAWGVESGVHVSEQKCRESNLLVTWRDLILSPFFYYY